MPSATTASKAWSWRFFAQLGTAFGGRTPAHRRRMGAGLALVSMTACCLCSAQAQTAAVAPALAPRQKTLAPPGYEVTSQQELSSGTLSYKRLQARQPPGLVHVVRLQLAPGPLRLAVSPEAAKGQTPTLLARDQKALVSMNGSFFDPAMKPLGLVMQGGKVWPGTRDTLGYHVFACTNDSHCIIEEKRGIFDGTIAATKAALALSGRPLLVSQGTARAPNEDDTCPQFCARRHPRAGIGLDASGRQLILVLVEGRQPTASGASLAEFAALMKNLGAAVAINLDGGGSAALVIGGNRVSGRPMGETDERPVANVLSILEGSTPAPKSPPKPGP